MSFTDRAIRPVFLLAASADLRQSQRPVLSVANPWVDNDDPPLES
jgi:hypothetical protein